jgi:dUTP pyrophosphatase
MESLSVVLLNPNATIPTRGSSGAAGYDLYSCGNNFSVEPFGNALISTGIAMRIPEGYYGRIAPRSGFSVRTSLIVNAGVIDSDYRGEIKVLLQNPTATRVSIGNGERIAQIIFEKIGLFELTRIDSLDETTRGSSGFGSTGS